MICAYLGPEGSYSHLAAKKMAEGCALSAYDSFPLMFAALEKGECDLIIIPIENTLNGEVTQNVDLMQSSRNLVAIEEGQIAIDHRLVYIEGSSIDKIKRVYSHRQALDQCSKFLFERLPEAKLVAVPSTSASLEMVKTPEDGCIAGAHMKREGYVFSNKNIADNCDNYTYFLKVVKGDIDESKHTKKIYFSVTCPNVSGGLIRLLSKISEHGLNMSKLQSRPIKDAADEFAFFIELEGDFADGGVREAIYDIERAALSFKLLGAY